MKKLAILSVLLMTSSQVTAQTIGAGTTWVNQYQSSLTISSVDANGKIVGTYVTMAKNFACQNEPMDLVGWTDGVHINFDVRWKNAKVDCNSITSWSGFVETGKIEVDWDLVYTDAGTGKLSHLKDHDSFDPK